MRIRSDVAAGSLLIGSLLACGCQQAAVTPAAAEEPSFTPVLSVKELMEHVVDPMADWIFDSAVIDVNDKGTVETLPLTDEDWTKVERGAMILAESANLLKMPRAMVPAGDVSLKQERGGPELTPAEIEAKVKDEPAQWAKHADGLRDAALEALKVVKARDGHGLFDVGDRIDKACEACHLEFWYPGDKQAVLDDQKKRATYDGK